MGNDVTINGRVAPYRRDLEGRDLAYEFHLMLSRLEIGDTLVIPHVVFVRLGPDNEVTQPPRRSSARRRRCARCDPR